MVLDWDGTVTERDTLHMAIERFGDLAVFVALEEELGRRLTLDEVIATEMATVRAPLERVVAWLVEHVRVRPGFRELVDAYDPLIVSAGFHELIEPILAREGVAARVAANHVEAAPGAGTPRSLQGRRASSAVSDASAARSRHSARSRTSATASPTAASRSRRNGVSPERPRALAGRGGRLVRAVRGPLRRAQRDGGPLVPPTLSRGRNT